MKKSALFDKAAAQYDESFTHSEIGKLQRQRVYYWLNQSNALTKMDTVFELNCGTGFDAAYFHQKGKSVIATDGSHKMIDYARKNRDQSIQFEQLNFRDLNQAKIQGDTIFSNFGGLNCVDAADLSTILDTISQHQKKGEQLIMVLMPRFCWMEGCYFFLKLKWKHLFRRNTKKAVTVNVDGQCVPTWYHSPGDVQKRLKNYQIKLKKPIAFFLPPSYLEPFFKRRPRLLKILYSLEKRLGRLSFLAGWSDHYILIAEKL